MKPKTKQVQLRLPVTVMQIVKRAAKMAGVTPTQAYNVLLAMEIGRRDAAHGEGGK